MSSPTAFDAFKGVLDDYAEDDDALPVRYENDFVQDLLDANTPAWVFAEIYGNSYDQDTIGAPGANRWLETGITHLHVMVPSGKGSATARQHAAGLMDLFREVTVAADLHMTEMSLGAGEPGTNFPNYWAFSLTIFWRRGDITS